MLNRLFKKSVLKGFLKYPRQIPEALKKFECDKKIYNKMNSNKNFRINKSYLYPMLFDYNQSAGDIGQYFYQDLWAAKKIFMNNPKCHYDIGSRVDGFILALLSFRDVTLIDIRPFKENIPGLNFIQADATNLNSIKDDSLESLSALCSLEHFGLGRYGDKIDPDSCFKAFKAIQRVMSPGGKFYLSVPVAKHDRLEFNAHRVFSPSTIIAEFSQMTLKEFKIQKVSGKTIYNPLENYKCNNKDNDLDFGFFEFEKPTQT